MNHITKKIIVKVFSAFYIIMLLAPVALAQQASDESKVRKANVGGYIIAQTEKVDESYNAGYSIGEASYPLL